MRKKEKADKNSRSADQDKSVAAWKRHLKSMRDDIDATREGKVRFGSVRCHAMQPHATGRAHGREEEVLFAAVLPYFACFVSKPLVGDHFFIVFLLLLSCLTPILFRGFEYDTGCLMTFF